MGLIPNGPSSSKAKTRSGVEWSPAYACAHRTVPVRDSKDPEGPALMFEPAAWSAFVTGVQAGEFPVRVRASEGKRPPPGFPGGGRHASGPGPAVIRAR
ncbi:DUF397 domain-containing protein [Streptomyces inhibens]|uniref:DUF397 domain-containing protein n=1 Tax=Streptomyces inhibens TaxID=2293571 RepID=UPI00402AE287